MIFREPCRLVTVQQVSIITDLCPQKFGNEGQLYRELEGCCEENRESQKSQKDRCTTQNQLDFKF